VIGDRVIHSEVGFTVTEKTDYRIFLASDEGRVCSFYAGEFDAREFELAPKPVGMKSKR
jgi:hypothetical protein